VRRYLVAVFVCVLLFELFGVVGHLPIWLLIAGAAVIVTVLLPVGEGEPTRASFRSRSAAGTTRTPTPKSWRCWTRPSRRPPQKNSHKKGARRRRPPRPEGIPQVP
jgi:hypothetical protein